MTAHTPSEYGSAVSGEPEAIKANLDMLSRWPDDGVWSGYVINDRPDTNGFRRIKKMHNKGIITKADTVKVPVGTRMRPKALWRLKDSAVSLIEQLITERDNELPCEHVGFTNTGEWIRCNHCNARFTSDEVRAHWESND